MLRNFFVRIISLFLSTGALLLTLVYLNNQPLTQPQTSHPVFSQNQKIIQPAQNLTGLGTLKFGELAFWRLNTPQTQITFESAERDPHTQNLATAKGKLLAGEILATNLLLGNQLVLATENLKVTNPGGTLVLSKTATETRLRVLSGGATVQIQANARPEINLVVPAGRELILDSAKLAAASRPTSAVERKLTAQKMLRIFRGVSNYEDQILSEALQRLKTANSYSQKIKLFLQEKLTFLPLARERFYQTKMLHWLADIAEQNSPNAVPEFLQQFSRLSAAKQKSLQKAAATTIYFTRLFPSAEILPRDRQKIIQLAKQENLLATLVGIAPLPANLNLTRQIILGEEGKIPSEITAELAAEVWLAKLQKKPNLTATNLEFFAKLNLTRVDLLSALIDQFRLAKFLVETEQDQLAAIALKDLAQLIQKNLNRTEITETEITELEILSAKGNELKNRLIFLTQSATGTTGINDPNKFLSEDPATKNLAELNLAESNSEEKFSTASKKVNSENSQTPTDSAITETEPKEEISPDPQTAKPEESTKKISRPKSELKNSLQDPEQ